MPATAIPWRASTPAPSESSIRPRTSVARASSSTAVGGSLEMQRSLWRTTPAYRESWKAMSVPLPTISSVEPPPMSTTKVGSLGGDSEVAPR